MAIGPLDGAAGGRYGIGSDSHVSRDPFEELRLLEYVQRLVLRKRNIVVGAISASVGTTLWLEASAGGARAMGRKMGALAAGQRADFVVLDGVRQDVSLTPEQLRYLGNRNFGVGCDQILLVEKATRPDVDFRYRIFNADDAKSWIWSGGIRKHELWHTKRLGSYQ